MPVSTSSWHGGSIRVVQLTTSGTVIVQPATGVRSETFIAAHGERLLGVSAIVSRVAGQPAVNGKPVFSQAWRARAMRKLRRTMSRHPWEWEATHAYIKAFRQYSARVILAEYGPTGVAVFDACRQLKLPLVVHFHGFDASIRRVLEEYRDGYQAMFQQSASVIAVSHAMLEQLVGLGCPRQKLIYCPYGVDCEKFTGAVPVDSSPTFLGVGRMVEKKGPHLTLIAFARARSGASCSIADGG